MALTILSLSLSLSLAFSRNNVMKQKKGVEGEKSKLHNQKGNVKVKRERQREGKEGKQERKKEFRSPRIYTRIRLGSWLVVFQRDYCLNPTGFYPDIDIHTRGTANVEQLTARYPRARAPLSLLVVNSNNNIMHYAFSITETLFCSRTTPLFKLSLRPVLSVISASLSRRPRSPPLAYNLHPPPSLSISVAQNATPRDSFQKFPPFTCR